jgi:hypothetical protein
MTIGRLSALPKMNAPTRLEIGTSIGTSDAHIRQRDPELWREICGTSSSVCGNVIEMIDEGACSSSESEVLGDCLGSTRACFMNVCKSFELCCQDLMRFACSKGVASEGEKLVRGLCEGMMEGLVMLVADIYRGEPALGGSKCVDMLREEVEQRLASAVLDGVSGAAATARESMPNLWAFVSLASIGMRGPLRDRRSPASVRDSGSTHGRSAVAPKICGLRTRSDANGCEV